jgi:hypothetical protein
MIELVSLELEQDPVPSPPNPRCSRRQDLGRLVGCGWGVGEVSVKGLRLARG